ncbi:hypothetical protein [Clostridium taeniosporum]|uniref:Uncharacterized protein n=1 Tax=Clostridium taeniosporum TaxID=394958 RepID=A0A1D7XKC7_9CLOT|nr:hypothetical protein [Clostridium taeniosporum]AOR23549.1 hypothetical protein BGI42_07290 [Clostridium taeniosporum]
MDRKCFIGFMGIVFGSLLLSLELYGLKFIQFIDLKVNGSCYTNECEYIGTGTISIAFIITIGIIIYSIKLIIKAKNKSNDKNNKNENF